MSLRSHGANISNSEVTNITSIGFWLLADDREFFVPFADYPGFRDATIAQIYAMQRLSPKQFYWSDLDIDIELDALERPSDYPLKFR